MTFACTVKINDGVVLASDSASTLLGTDPQSGLQVPVNTYFNANKVFNLVKGKPVGLITWGIGGFGSASISSLVKDLRNKLQPRYDAGENLVIKDVAAETYDFMLSAYHAAYSELPIERQPYTGMLVAGYSVDGNFAEQYQIDFIGPVRLDSIELWPGDQSGILWRGQMEAVSRLLIGFSPQLESIFENYLGVPLDQAKQAIDYMRGMLSSSLISDSMPIQDAVDLAKFLVDVATNYSRFSPGAQIVGGPVEIAVITRHEDFKWVERKHYYNEELNKPYDKQKPRD